MSLSVLPGDVVMADDSLGLSLIIFKMQFFGAVKIYLPENLRFQSW